MEFLFIDFEIRLNFTTFQTYDDGMPRRQKCADNLRFQSKFQKYQTPRDLCAVYGDGAIKERSAQMLFTLLEWELRTHRLYPYRSTCSNE